LEKNNGYTRNFGSIKDLGDPLPWTEGVANIYEHIAWYTATVLGVTKTTFWKTILEWNDDPALTGLTLDQRVQAIKTRLQEEVNRNEAKDRYDKLGSTIAKPYECLRRQRFFSEDYLNKEFDLFLSLASDQYVSALYGQIYGRDFTGAWSVHGNGGRFQVSTLYEMQMDNIAYNRDCHRLVANELKLGGKKNRDQILKYARLFQTLLDRALVPDDTEFHLLFISDQEGDPDWDMEIDGEIDHIRRVGRNGQKRLVDPEVIELARRVPKAFLTWHQLINFNEEWMSHLKPEQSVEKKLLSGFNQTLGEKYYLRSRQGVS